MPREFFTRHAQTRPAKFQFFWIHSILEILWFSSPIQTLTVGARFTLAPPQNAGHGLQALLVTAGRELHPAPKNLFNSLTE